MDTARVLLHGLVLATICPELRDLHFPPTKAQNANPSPEPTTGPQALLALWGLCSDKRRTGLPEPPAHSMH